MVWCDVVVWCGFLTDYKTTQTKVVLSCFGLLVGLWQLGPPNCFSPQILFFCELKPHAKFQNLKITPSVRKVCEAEEERRKSEHLVP